MDRVAVSSSSLAEVGYDAATETLEIMFLSGLVYQYYNVPVFVHERFMHAQSMGGFFNSEIRRHYQEARL